MASPSPSKKGAIRYTTDIEKHFEALGFKYNPSQHVLDNFAACIQFLGPQPAQQFFTQLFAQLNEVVSTCDGPFSPSSGLPAYAQKAYNLRFPGAVFNPDQGVCANIARLRASPEWRTWTSKGAKLPDPARTLRRMIARQMRQDWVATRQTRNQKAQVTKKSGELASAQSSVASSSKNKEQVTNKTVEPASGQSSVAPSSTKKAQAVSTAEVEELLSKAALAFFANYKDFPYQASDPVEINFLRFVKFKKLKQVARVDDYLRSLIEQATGFMEPAAIDRVWKKDYAKKFFAGFEFFKPTPGSSFREEFHRLTSHKLFKHRQAPSLKRLKQSVAGNLAIDIKNSLKDSPRLCVLANPRKIIAQGTAAIPKVQPVRTSQSSSPQTDDGIPVSLQRWLDQYPKFTPDPNESLITEFDRLALAQNWSHRSKTYKSQRTQFFTRQFEDEWSEIVYTPDDSDDDDDGEGPPHGVSLDKAYKLSQWQDLCNELGIEPMPKTQTQCRKALEKINVNIVDLLEARRVNKTNGDGTVAVRRFETAGALGRYIRKNPEKIFSKGEAKRQGALRALLVHVFSSPCGKRALA